MEFQIVDRPKERGVKFTALFDAVIKAGNDGTAVKIAASDVNKASLATAMYRRGFKLRSRKTGDQFLLWVVPRTE